MAGYRTDTLMIASLNPSEGTGTLLSIPRDLYVYIPGWKISRINTAEPRGGFEMIANTVLYNFGIPLHHWVRVEFTGLSKAVNLLGGITVQSTGNLYDECGGTYYSYGVDEYKMDGFTALCYVRMRKTSSDFDRLRRQQEVVRAMFSQVIRIDGLEKVPELFELFGHTFATDLRLDDLLELLPLAASMATDPASVRQFSIDQSMTEGFRVPGSGAAVLLPRRGLIQAMLNEAFGD